MIHDEQFASWLRGADKPVAFTGAGMSTLPHAFLYEPEAAIILQGRKEVVVGDEKFVYDTERCLLTSINLPVVSYVTEATAERPFMAMVVKLELARIRQLIKVGAFSHADAGQMHMYLNYAREHWTLPNENPPVGLILCAQKDEAMAKYALEGLPNQVLAAEYRAALPDEQMLIGELDRTRQELLARQGPADSTSTGGTA